MRKTNRFLVGTWLAAMALLAGPTRGDDGLPEPRALGRELRAFAPADTDAEPQTPPAPTGVIQLRDAVASALLRSPALAATSQEVRARDARIVQAGLLPNPVVSFELEDVGGSRDYSGVDESQSTLAVAQLLELGGKRAARADVAAKARALAGWDYEAKRLDVLTATADAFVDVLGAQERVRQTDEAIALAEQLVSAAAERVRAGATSAVEEMRARLALGEAKLARANADTALAADRRRLATSWDEREPGFVRAEGDLRTLAALPAEAALVARLADRPEVARFDAEREEREAELTLQRARAVPDVSVMAAVRRLAGPDQTVFVGGVAVPLPLFDRNQGAIAEADRRVRKAVHERRTEELRARSELTDALRSATRARTDAETLRTALVPQAESALAAVRRGYREGQLSQLEVVDAQRQVVTLRERELAALVEFHHAVVALERLTGAPIDATR
jgi:cobalt-zinc-cadmium efflux system outer membrane protein